MIRHHYSNDSSSLFQDNNESKTICNDHDPIIISHDHYDHLDHKAVRWLADLVKHFFVPLGVKAHLVRWDVDPNAITEMDWYESEMHRNVQLTLAPARHFSGRGLWDRNATLWGSWTSRARRSCLTWRS